MKRLTSTRYAFPEALVPAGGSMQIYTSLPSADRPFQPMWYNIPEEIARRFLITDIKVGMNSQLISTGCIPADLFVNLAGDPDVAYHSLMEVGMRLTISVANMSAFAQVFRCEILGYHPTAEEDLVPSNDPRRARIEAWFCGFGSTLVEESAVINVQPQVAFEPYRLFVPTRILDQFTVDQLVVRPYSNEHKGPGPTILSRAPEPCLATSNLLRYGYIQLSPEMKVDVANFLCVSVTNKTGRPTAFHAAILG